MTTTLLGQSFIGYSRSTGTATWCRGVQPGSGVNLDPAFTRATAEEVERAVALAAEAFPVFSSLAGKARAGFLRAAAGEIEEILESIIPRAQLETALPEARLRTEAGRTVGQLRMFADLIEEGSWVDARIERAQPDHQPIPRVDLRSMLRPLGPVAVFCASNFPLAYSVAGGDTASALAAGCPVIVIAHEAHPGVAEMVAGAVIRAALATGMPEGVFSMLHGGGKSVGVEVVKHPAIQAVGFTGSRSGGTTLMEIASQRPQPIPVFAEMSSINPVVILPGALKRGAEALAEAFSVSLTSGVGQFCTNPGLVFLPERESGDFLKRLKSLVEVSPPGMMLHDGICQSYQKSTAAVADTEGVELLARGMTPAGPGEARPMVFLVSLKDFLAKPTLQREMFGPATLVVQAGVDEIEAAIPRLEGQLTASLHGTDEELQANPRLVAALQGRAGRLIFDGFPTGLQVGISTVHGGPFPATSDGRSSSVGTLSITRFCRPVAWQNSPDAVLPVELREGNPLGIRRME